MRENRILKIRGIGIYRLDVIDGIDMVDRVDGVHRGDGVDEVPSKAARREARSIRRRNTARPLLIPLFPPIPVAPSPLPPTSASLPPPPLLIPRPPSPSSCTRFKSLLHSFALILILLRPLLSARSMARSGSCTGSKATTLRSHASSDKA